MKKRIIITEKQLNKLLGNDSVDEGQGLNMFKHDSRELWSGNEDMRTLRDKWNDLGNSDGNYNEYIRNGRNNAAFYGGDMERWYDRNGMATDSEYDRRTGSKNAAINRGDSGKMGRRLGMAGVKAQIPLRMAAEPIYRTVRNVKSVMGEALDKEFGQKLKDTLDVDDNTKLRNRITWHGLYYFPKFCDNQGIEISGEDAERCEENDLGLLDDIMDGKYGEDAAAGFVDYLENSKGHDKPSSSVMTYVRDLNNAWVIHFSFDAEGIWMNGFRNASRDIEELGFSKGRDDEGFNFGYCVDRGSEQYFTKRTTAPNYGDAAVLFQTSGVEIWHDYDEEYQAVFYNNDARNLILVEMIDEFEWGVRSNRGGRVLYRSEDIQDVIEWAIGNFPQYGSLMVNPRESRIRKDAMRRGRYGRMVAENIEDEALDKYFANGFKKYMQDDSDDSIIEEYFYKRGIYDFPKFCEENGIELTDDEIEMCEDSDWDMMREIMDGKYEEYLKDYYNWKMRHDYENPMTKQVMTYEKTLNNAWLIHFSDNAASIWENGFRYTTDDVSQIGYSGAGRTDNKAREGLCFAYPVKNGFRQMFDGTTPHYGREAILFQANCVVAYHGGDNESQAIFYNNDARNLIYIEEGDSYSNYVGEWVINSNKTGRPLVHNEDFGKVVEWAIRNFQQYGSQMVNPREYRYKRDAMKKSEYNSGRKNF